MRSQKSNRVLLVLVAPVAVGLFQCLPQAGTLLADCTSGFAPAQGDYTQCVPVPGEQGQSTGQLPGGFDLSDGQSQGSWGAAGTSGGAALSACEATAGAESEYADATISCPSA